MTQDNKNIRNNIIWNTVGSLFYLVCQWFLSVVIVRLSPQEIQYDEAGILTLVMSFTNVFSAIALFNVRSYQSSDIDEKYTSSEYFCNRLATCGIALVLCFVFALINRYEAYVLWSIMGYMTVKIIEAIADVIHGTAQRKWRLDIAGKSFLLRGVTLISTFSVTQYLFNKIPISIAVMALSNLLVLVLYDMRVIKKVDNVYQKSDKKAIIGISLICLPMLGYSVCVNSIVPFARYYMEKIYGEEILGYYGTVSTVAVLIQAVASFLFSPLVGLVAEYDKNGDKKSIIKLIAKVLVILSGVTIVAFLGSYFLGEFVLSLVFGKEIIPYAYLLYPTIVISVITSLVWIMGMTLITFRKTISLLVGAGIGIVVEILLAIILMKTDKDAYFGANASTIISLSIVAVIYIVRVVIYLCARTQDKQTERESL